MYTALIRNRQARLMARAIKHPEESYDERVAVVVAEEQSHLVEEIPPYISDAQARMLGQPPVYAELLNSMFYMRAAKDPVCCLLFIDQGVHRIITFALTNHP